MAIASPTGATTPMRLALIACEYPGGFLDRTPRPSREHQNVQLQPGPADRTHKLLLDWVDQAREEDSVTPLIVRTGDQIYIDATAGLFDPVIASGDGLLSHQFAEALERAYVEPRGAHYRSASTMSAIDDHEIVDNWERSLDPARNAALERRMVVAKRAFADYAAGASSPNGTPSLGLWRPLSARGQEFFVADTRTEREARDPSRLNDARIMSCDQFSDLRRWLESNGQPGKRRRIIVTPSILLPRRLATERCAASAWRSDAWDGYPRSLHDMLALVAEATELTCLFLSGDEHLPCVVKATVERLGREAPAPSTLWSIHTGAMYAPYPFANGRPEDFSDEPSFEFGSDVTGHMQRYRCAIQHKWFPREAADGFTSIELDEVAASDPKIAFHASTGAIHHYPGDAA